VILRNAIAEHCFKSEIRITSIIATYLDDKLPCGAVSILSTTLPMTLSATKYQANSTGISRVCGQQRVIDHIGINSSCKLTNQANLSDWTGSDGLDTAI